MTAQTNVALICTKICSLGAVLTRIWNDARTSIQTADQEETYLQTYLISMIYVKKTLIASQGHRKSSHWSFTPRLRIEEETLHGRDNPGWL